MQYVIFGFLMVLTLMIGFILGLLIPSFILKHYKYKLEEPEEKEPAVETTPLQNMTPELINEWLNGKAGEK